MDRTRVCGTRNPGSIPGEGTTVYEKHVTYVTCFSYSTQTALRAYSGAKWNHVSAITNAETGELGVRSEYLELRKTLSTLVRKVYRFCKKKVLTILETK